MTMTRMYGTLIHIYLNMNMTRKRQEQNLYRQSDHQRDCMYVH